MKTTYFMKRGMSVLLAAIITFAALPNVSVYAEGVQTFEMPVQLPEERERNLEEQEMPFYRLVKKGEASESGYQEMIWVDADGKEAEGESSYGTGDTKALYGIRESFPSSYNMSEHGELPAVRNQGKWGTCWAHAALSSVESNMIKKGFADASEVDYSERHLAYFAHRRDVGLGDGADEYDDTYGWYGGGNYYDAMNMLSNWYGAAAESAYPYVSYGDMEDLNETDRKSSVCHLTDASILSTAEDVKRAVMENGAVMCSFYSGDGTFNTAQVNVYHASEGLGTDHAVSIVGWDDSYSKTNFNDNGRVPAENGAWRCRNSWGGNWAENGYFWISYEDTSLTSFCSFEAENADNYENIYGYNGSDANVAIGFEKTANAYLTMSAEELRAVSVRVRRNYDYVVEVYVEGENGMTVPSDGVLVYSQKGSLAYPGYHVIPLEKNVLLGSGMKYAVAVQLIAKGDDRVFSYMETNENFSSQRGESFVYSGGVWSDAIDYDRVQDTALKNAYINAFTDNIALIDKARLLQEIEAVENEHLQEADYTAATWSEFIKAKENAQTLYQSESPGENEILKAVRNLASARTALKEKVVLIADENEFEAFSKSVSSGNAYEEQTVRLLRDLDMDGVLHNAIGTKNYSFQGTFDGGGHSITNLSYEYAYSYGGLFGVVGERGMVKDITLAYTQLELGATYSGGIAGRNQGTISGCKVTGENLNFKSGWTGAVTGANDGIIQNCAVEGELVFDCGAGSVGGIAGNNPGKIEACYADGCIQFLNQTDRGNFVGGIAGISQGEILKCYMKGKILSDSAASVGGIVGYGYDGSTVNLCYNLASISGNPSNEARTAGIGVCLYGSTANCYNYGKISRISGDEKGALYCNRGSGTFSNCYYLDTSCNKGGYSPAFSQGALTESEFASAKAAYYLNSSGGTGKNTYVWSQSQKENVPILADSGNRPVIKVLVSQSGGSQCRASLNGVTDGAFYAKAGERAKLLLLDTESHPGYNLSVHIEGLVPSEEDESIYILPDEDVQAVIDCQKSLINYSIVYHLNRGAGTGQETYHVESEVELFTPVREGAEFLGWYDNEELQGDPVRRIAKGSIGNREFWAKWHREGYEVIFPEKKGFQVTSCDGYVNGKLQEGDSYLFTVKALQGYDISDLTIRCEGTVLTPEDGVYRIDNIISDIEDISMEGIKLGKGNYTAEIYNGYIGETCTIRPVSPATGIKLETESEFSDSITINAKAEISIVTADEEGNVSDAETIHFEQDLTAPNISSAEAVPESIGGHFAGVYITVSAEDNESGIAEYSFDNGANWQEENRYYVQCEAQERIFGQKILVRDHVGNTAQYFGEIIIPAFVKYDTSVTLYADKEAYMTGSDFVLKADVAFEKMEEDLTDCGKVHFLTVGGEIIQTAQVVPVSDTTGRAQIIVSGDTAAGPGEIVFQAAYDGSETIYQDSRSEECRIIIADAKIKNPVFADIEVKQGTQTAAGASDLGTEVLPVSGTITAKGAKVPYQIVWNPSVILDLTKAGNSAVFTGTISYESVPEWTLLPESLAVSRKVTVKKSASDNLEYKDQEFKKGAQESSGPAVYRVLDAKKKTAVLFRVADKNITTLKIPATVKICGVICRVVQIGSGAAKGCKKLTKAVLGKNITTIGAQAFFNCRKLKSIQFKGKAVKTVKKKAFKKTAAKITVQAKKMNKKQKNVLLKKLKTAGISKKAKVR